jgi:Putative RNA methylase family UPF0020
VRTVGLVGLLDVGWTEVALEALRANGHQPQVRYRDESCLAFSCPSAITAHDMRWAKNYFTVLATAPRGPLTKTLSGLTGQVPEHLDLGKEAASGFRIVVHIDGQLTSVDAGVRGRLEAAVRRASGATVSRRGGGAEIWVLGRRQSPIVWLLKRRMRAEPRRSRAGSLSPRLASLLCLASRPTPDDVFLDPFAGSGSISLARRSWPARTIYASDQEPIPWPSRRPSDVVPFTRDVRELSDAIPEAISVVVTDPPWNEFVQLSDYKRLLADACNTMARLALPAGDLRVVMLINRRGTEPLGRSLQSAGFRHIHSESVVVNGHPSSVLTAEL